MNVGFYCGISLRTCNCYVTYTVFQFINMNASKNLPCKVVYNETLQHAKCSLSEV